MPVRARTALLFAELLLLLTLWKLCCPRQTETLRAWAAEAMLPEARQTVEAWGRALAGEEERVAVQGPGEKP